MLEPQKAGRTVEIAERSRYEILKDVGRSILGPSTPSRTDLEQGAESFARSGEKVIEETYSKWFSSLSAAEKARLGDHPDVLPLKKDEFTDLFISGQLRALQPRKSEE